MSRNGSTRVFAERLRQYREQRGLSRRDLADRLDVTAATVSNWELGRGFPMIRLREPLCVILGVSAKKLHLPPYNARDDDGKDDDTGAGD